MAAVDVVMAGLRPLTLLGLVWIISLIIHKLIGVSLIVLLSALWMVVWN